LRGNFVFCPACGTNVVGGSTKKPKLGRDLRVSRRVVAVAFLPVLFIGMAISSVVGPWFQNLSMNLESKSVGLELQTGNDSSNWLSDSSTFRAKISLPTTLTDSATVKLEKLEGGLWVEQDSSEVKKSAVVPLQHTFSTTEKQSVRVSLYSGSKLIQTSNVKSVKGVKAPKGSLVKGGNTYYRYFTQTEYDSVSTPGCGSYCWGLWVSTPTKSTLTLWVEDKGKVISKKVKVTIAKVGVLKKVILPSLGFGDSGLLKIESRPATAEELRQASKPTPRTNNSGSGTPSGCEKLSTLLERRELQAQVIYKAWGGGLYSPIDNPEYFYKYFNDEGYVEESSKLVEIENEIKRCY
jgi:hypothetical protein